MHPAVTCVDSRGRAFRRPRLRAGCTRPPGGRPTSVFLDAAGIPSFLESTRSTARAAPGVHREGVAGRAEPVEDPIFS